MKNTLTLEGLHNLLAYGAPRFGNLNMDLINKRCEYDTNVTMMFFTFKNAKRLPKAEKFEGYFQSQNIRYVI
jgi:hypothetical protein